MKKQLVFLFSFCSLALLLAGQTDTLDHSIAPVVREGIRPMSKGAQTGFTIFLPETNETTVYRLWKDVVREFGGRLKKVRRSDEYYAADVNIANISGRGSTNLYTLLNKIGNDVEMTAWFELSDGNFLNSKNYPAPYREAQQILSNFGIQVKKYMVRQELEAEQRALEKLVKTLERLVRNKEGLERDIANFQSRIEKAQADIIENKAAQADIQNQIEAQQIRVDEVSKRLNDIH